jgi:chitosanase
MFYAILGDTNGNNPQVIGEASWLLGTTMFPNDDLNGGTSHPNTDVLCNFLLNGLILDIVFMTEFPAVNETNITDFDALQQMGDEKINDLIRTINETGPGGQSHAPSTFIPMTTQIILLTCIIAIAFTV